MQRRRLTRQEKGRKGEGMARGRVRGRKGEGMARGKGVHDGVGNLFLLFLANLWFSKKMKKIQVLE